MILQQVLDQGRAAAEARMTSTCVITRGGSATFDEDTGLYTAADGDTVYTGKCRLKTASVAVRSAQFGGREVVTVEPQLSIPISDSDTSDSVPTAGDRVLMTASADDPALVGASLTVLGPVKGDQMTARRLRVEESDG